MTTQQPCLQSENEQLRAGYDAARLEIESLRERVQQLGQLARDVNSRRVTELEAQLAAVGAGGVEPLRKRECLHQISEPVRPVFGLPGTRDIDVAAAQKAWDAAQTQPAAQALDAGQWTSDDCREFCAIGRAINRAAGRLPDHARVRIDLENGAGTAYWLDNASGAWRYIDSDDLFSTQIDAATDAAIAAQQGEKP